MVDFGRTLSAMAQGAGAVSPLMAPVAAMTGPMSPLTASLILGGGAVANGAMDIWNQITNPSQTPDAIVNAIANAGAQDQATQQAAYQAAQDLSNQNVANSELALAQAQKGKDAALGGYGSALSGQANAISGAYDIGRNNLLNMANPNSAMLKELAGMPMLYQDPTQAIQNARNGVINNMADAEAGLSTQLAQSGANKAVALGILASQRGGALMDAESQVISAYDAANKAQQMAKFSAELGLVGEGVKWDNDLLASLSQNALTKAQDPSQVSAAQLAYNDANTGLSSAQNIHSANVATQQNVASGIPAQAAAASQAGQAGLNAQLAIAQGNKQANQQETMAAFQNIGRGLAKVPGLFSPGPAVQPTLQAPQQPQVQQTQPQQPQVQAQPQIMTGGTTPIGRPLTQQAPPPYNPGRPH